jgi:hypothetical protein
VSKEELGAINPLTTTNLKQYFVFTNCCKYKALNILLKKLRVHFEITAKIQGRFEAIFPLTTPHSLCFDELLF